ncbi:MAG: hypothetical protein GF307_10965 [candidate division Zixibacteria bacterium]|nr:hypothetical protein [candidate division Zixibacteria bacterium]
MKYKEAERMLELMKDSNSQLVTATKLSCLSSLVSGIAHELNNPVGAIKSSADVASRVLERLEKKLMPSIEDNTKLKVDGTGGIYLRMAKEQLAVIQNVADRIAETVQTLKNFSYLDQAQCQTFNINDGLDGVLSFFEHQIGDGIKIEKNYGKLPAINCHPGEINQVFMNLLRNAFEAIGDRGIITITTYADEKNIYAKIKDTGKGIPEEDIEKIFDINLKKNGERVKMTTGLSSSLSIIHKHNGELTAVSSPEEYTEFTIKLPIGEFRC